MRQYECEGLDKEILGDCKSHHSGDMGHNNYTYSRDLDYQGVTLELDGDMAEHGQDYRTTAKVGSMFTTNKQVKKEKICETLKS